MAFSRAGTLWIEVHDSHPPAKEEWDAMMQAYRAYDAQSGGKLHECCALIFSDGGGPSSAQRLQLRDVLNGRNARASVVTDSLLMVGIISAITIFDQGSLKAFTARDWRKALEWCLVDQTRTAEVFKVALNLRHEVTESKLLAKLEM
jgi:hypothetical protein